MSRVEKPTFIRLFLFLKKILNASIDLLSIPHGGENVKTLSCGIIGCKDKTSLGQKIFLVGIQ